MTKPILIVGAGPTGLTAALELSRLGVPLRIIDEQAAPATTSRAVGVQARTLELLELRGLSDEMVGLGNPGLAASFYGGGKRAFQEVQAVLSRSEVPLLRDDTKLEN
jgi:2-polyprenyl-6-methoxyphenol hydroxylase-like FAD-dependent oxidoreductase